MRVKICGIRTEEDIKIAVRADADAVGLLVGQLHASPDFILPSTASRLAKQLPPYISPVIVTHLTEAEAVMEIVDKTGIFTVQLHGNSPVEDVRNLRDMLPVNGKVIYAVHVIQNRLEVDPESFYPFIDALLLDTYSKDKGQVQGSGMIHNWEVSARIVQECPLPVILAGGLTPENVSEAIFAVKPFCVDANTGLKREDGEGRDPEKCREFVRNAKVAGLEIHQPGNNEYSE